MRVNGVQERVPEEAIRSRADKSRRIIGTSVATRDIVGRIPPFGIINSKLSVIENVERFGAKLQACRFTRLELLEQRHVEIQTAGIIQGIPAHIPECQPFRCDKCLRVA